MPRATNARKEKESFTWDSEEHLGFAYPHEGARKCTEVKRAKKDGKDYIVLTEWRYYAKKPEDGGEPVEQWNPIKGMTIPAHMWEDIHSFAFSSLEQDPPEIPEPEE